MNFTTLRERVVTAVKNAVSAAEADVEQVIHPVEAALTQAEAEFEAAAIAIAADARAGVARGVAAARAQLPALTGELAALIAKELESALAAHGL